MRFTRESDKDFSQLCEDLQAAFAAVPFGVMHVHDIGNTLRSKGFEMAAEIKVFEVCQPGVAQGVLNADFAMHVMLPCRVSVFQQPGGKPTVEMAKTDKLFAVLTESEEAMKFAVDVQAKLEAAINSAV